MKTKAKPFAAGEFLAASMKVASGEPRSLSASGLPDSNQQPEKTMNAHRFSSPFKSAFCGSSRDNEAHFFQDISNDSRAALRRLLLFQQTVSALLTLLIFTVGRADPLDTWAWRNPLPTGNHLNGVAYRNGLFVAVGDVGTILTSAD